MRSDFILNSIEKTLLENFSQNQNVASLKKKTACTRRKLLYFLVEVFLRIIYTIVAVVDVGTM